MSPKEFLIFLNGAIELGNINELDSENFKIVNEKLIEINNDNTPEGIFCTWLKGFMEAGEEPEVSVSQFNKITHKLFELKQEKTSEDTKQSSYVIEKTSSKLSKDNMMRC